ncbi:hypothetical protein ILUMI_24873 [Ignelater luminosus]|uniref:Uncharacterized protein n=1 Tax=Ignelater luminosus TaxID=2038154 RepID=A0A8K0C5J6_IGNLU|nr:hypothetical protein ILUMI_24873 [Ignelater luminosus]
MIRRKIKNSGLKYSQRRKCPKYTLDQLAGIPGCCRALRRNHFSDDIENCPDQIKFKSEKIEGEVLLWCAISKAGVSRPYAAHVRDEAIDANIYTQRCLPK